MEKKQREGEEGRGKEGFVRLRQRSQRDDCREIKNMTLAQET